MGTTAYQILQHTSCTLSPLYTPMPRPYTSRPRHPHPLLKTLSSHHRITRLLFIPHALIPLSFLPILAIFPIILPILPHPHRNGKAHPTTYHHPPALLAHAPSPPPAVQTLFPPSFAPHNNHLNPFHNTRGHPGKQPAPTRQQQEQEQQPDARTLASLSRHTCREQASASGKGEPQAACNFEAHRGGHRASATQDAASLLSHPSFVTFHLLYISQHLTKSTSTQQASQ